LGIQNFILTRFTAPNFSQLGLLTTKNQNNNKLRYDTVQKWFPEEVSEYLKTLAKNPDFYKIYEQDLLKFDINDIKKFNLPFSLNKKLQSIIEEL